MKKSIDIKGITTTSAYVDGDCMSVVNLRKKNGVLKPVTPRKTIKTLTSQYDVLFVHQLPSTGENWICVRGGHLYFVQHIGLPEQVETTICALNSIPQITQIGNVLNVLDTTGLQYVIWYENEYKVINSNFDGTQTDGVLGPVKVDLKVDGYADGTNRKTLNFYSDTDVAVGTPHDTKQQMCSGLLAKAKAYDDSQGRLTGFILACTALELYDGSFILHSNPILLGQAYDEKTRYSSEEIAGHDYITNPAMYYSPGAVAWDEVVTNADEYYEKVTNDIITGTSAADDVLTNYFPNAFCSDYFLKIDGASTVKRMVCRKSSNVLKIKINNTISADYRTLVKSVCVFITNQITAQDYASVEYKGYFDYNGVTANRAENYFAKPKSNEDIIKELETTQQFYKVKEIPFEEIVAGDWIDISEDLKGKLGDNLVSQEELTVDNSTHHTLLPRIEMVYNSKLHAIDYKTLFSRGFPLRHFQVDEGIGQFFGDDYSPSSAAYLNYIVVELKTTKGISKVVRYGTDPITFRNLGMLSYPDTRAKSITVYQFYSNFSGSYSSKQTFVLKASETQNFAYYIAPDLKPIAYTFTAGAIETVPTEVEREDIYRNGIKISAVINPFYFPSANTISVGTGFIFNAGTNAIRMSEGQFGQYDLYVFTSEGIYSLDTGTTVTYNRISPASLELPVSGIICSTPFGVIYIGKRGLFIINGQQVDFLTPQLEQEPLTLALNMPTSQQVGTIGTIKTWNDWFKTYLQGVTDIIYDNQNNEIIIVNAGYEYNIVYNLDSKEIYQQTEVIDKVVQNVYPELKVTQKIIITTPAQDEIIPAYDEPLYNYIVGSNVDTGIGVSGVVVRLLREGDVNYNASIPRAIIIIEHVTAPWLITFSMTQSGYTTPGTNAIMQLIKDEGYSFTEDYWLSDSLDDNYAMFYQASTNNVQSTLKTIEKKSFSWRYVDLPSNASVHHVAVTVHHEQQTTETNTIKDYSLSDNTPAQVSFITRPFNFGITEIKKLERTILRARLNLSENIIAMNHCSNDGANFVPVQGKTLINGNYRDIDLGLMVRNKHRQFIYAFAAKLDEDSQIGQIDCEVVVEYGNEKMR